MSIENAYCYDSINDIYLVKVAELCGEGFYPQNSANLNLCRRLYEKEGYSWKVIYFALLRYNNWLTGEWKRKTDEEPTEFERWCDSAFDFTDNEFDPDGRKLQELLKQTDEEGDLNMVAEELVYLFW